MKPMSEFITWAHQRRPLLRIMPLPLAGNLVLAVVGAAVAGWCFVRNFWTLGDLYLLGRVADQMWAGHGLVWNQGEPVQVYTSAAWMLVIAATRPLIDDLYVQALVLHALLLAGLLGVLYWHFRSGALLAAAALAFTASWGFFDYTAGGLENGLAFLMVAIFAVGLFRKWELCHLAAVAGLTLLVRHDLLLLVGPALAWAAWGIRGDLSARRALAAGMLLLAPVTLWTAFAWLYYGDPLPAVATHKLAFYGGTVGARLATGVIYWWANLMTDPLSIAVMAAAANSVLFTRDRAAAALMAGVGLYVLYVLATGAQMDHIGRHTGWCYLVSVIVLLAACAGTERRRVVALGSAMVCMAFLLAVGYHTALAPAYDYWDKDEPWAITLFDQEKGEVLSQDGFVGPGRIGFWRDGRRYSPSDSLPVRVRNDWDQPPEGHSIALARHFDETDWPVVDARRWDTGSAWRVAYERDRSFRVLTGWTAMHDAAYWQALGIGIGE